uniref:Uncharacterized protein n=1 Tax=viral metagenome TaxID=1070528 RepID=A0A6C0JYG7_9ZZZZ
MSSPDREREWELGIKSSPISKNAKNAIINTSRVWMNAVRALIALEDAKKCCDASLSDEQKAKLDEALIASRKVVKTAKVCYNITYDRLFR